MMRAATSCSGAAAAAAKFAGVITSLSRGALHSSTHTHAHTHPCGRTVAAAAAAAPSAAGSVRWLKILAADPVDPICGEVFRDAGHKLVEKKMNQSELLSAVTHTHYDALVVRSGVKVTADIIRAGTKLKVIGRAGAGVDNIDTVAATRQGVIVMNTPGGNTSAAAELTLSLLMNMARQIPAAVSSLKTGVWDRKKFSAGVELKGKTIGIVGLGAIGSEVARRCQALDMITIGFDPLITDEKAAAYGIKKVSLEALFASSDFITLHTPLNDATRNLINKTTLAKCKNGVFIINCARGGIVNEGDVLEALDNGKVAGAAFDVFEQEPPGPTSKALIAHPRVVCTPHLGASTEEAQRKVAREIAQQMSDALAGRAYVGVVNASHLALANRPTLEPYVRLSQAVGSLQAQMWSGPVKNAKITVDLEGPVFDDAGSAPGSVCQLVKAAVLQGLLPALPSSDIDADGVNLVNAALLADEADLKVAVKQVPHSTSSSYSNAIRMAVVTSSGERVVVGSVIGDQPRIVQVDHWQSFPTFLPEGHVLLFNNLDKPGAVSRVTTVLADHNINIASLAIARQYPGSPALSVLLCDSRIPAEVSAKISELDGITNVRTASFGDAYTKPPAVATS